MDIDPHTLQQILQRIHQQMRCPQCGKRVPVDFSSIRVVAEQALILQLKCDICNAYIVLQATLQGGEMLESDKGVDKTANISSNLQLSQDEVKLVSKALENAGGSFQQLFKDYNIGESSSEVSDEEEI